MAWLERRGRKETAKGEKAHNLKILIFPGAIQAAPFSLTYIGSALLTDLTGASELGRNWRRQRLRSGSDSHGEVHRDAYCFCWITDSRVVAVPNVAARRSAAAARDIAHVQVSV